MRPETLQLIGQIVVCLVAAAIIMHSLRHFFRPRKNGQSLTEFIEEASKEGQLDQRAKFQMLGTHTKLINAVQFLLMLATLWCTRYWTPLPIWVVAYLAIGFWATRKPAALNRRPDYERLAVYDRFQYRLSYAWFWPAYMYFRLKRT